MVAGGLYVGESPPHQSTLNLGNKRKAQNEHAACAAATAARHSHLELYRIRLRGEPIPIQGIMIPGSYGSF